MIMMFSMKMDKNDVFLPEPRLIAPTVGRNITKDAGPLLVIHNSPDVIQRAGDNTRGFCGLGRPLSDPPAADEACLCRVEGFCLATHTADIIEGGDAQVSGAQLPTATPKVRLEPKKFQVPVLRRIGTPRAPPAPIAI